MAVDLCQGRCNANGFRFVGAAVVISLLMLCRTALAANYVVGDASGWTIMSYDSWKEGKTFMVGDTLQFVYTSVHDVVQVNSANYDACAKGTNTINTDGNTTYQLTTSGDVYFICTVDSHCQQGMKLEVNVEAASNTSTTPSTATPPTTSTPPTTNTTSSPPNSSTLSIPPSMATMSLILGVILVFFRSS